MDCTCQRNLESFHMKCQRHILGIRWRDRICNTEIIERTGLLPLMDQIIIRRNSLFDHVARLGSDTPAHQALRRQIDISLGRLPDRTWKRPRGRPRNKCLDQIRSDNNLPPADLWRSAIRRGHSGVHDATVPAGYAMMTTTGVWTNSLKHSTKAQDGPVFICLSI